MDDLEKMIAAFEYIRDPDKISKDAMEFVDVLKVVVKMFENSDLVLNMDPMDVVHFLVAAKNFSDELKPLAIKYQIIPGILQKPND